MEPDQRGESYVLDPALAFLNTVALACFEILSYLLAAVPTDISLCCRNDCKGRYIWVEPFLLLARVLFCSRVSSFYVEASLQREGGSVTAPYCVPCLGFNKQY